MNLTLRSLNFRMAQSIRTKVESSVKKEFRRYADHISDLKISLRDVIAPGGQHDKEARVEAHLAHSGTVFAEVRGNDYGAAIRSAASRIGNQLERYLFRHRAQGLGNAQEAGV